MYFFRRMYLPKGQHFLIAVIPDSEDPIQRRIAMGLFDFMPNYHLMFHLTKPGLHVLDLGGHIGLFALSMAAQGAMVITVEASPNNARQLELSVAKNSFETISVVQAAALDKSGTVEFMEYGPYGTVANPHMRRDTIRVPSRTASQILQTHNWENVDLVKMDIEGTEMAALDGMESLLSNPSAPIVVYESNNHTLNFFDHTPQQLLARFEGWGYTNWLIDQNKLSYWTAADPQIRTVSEYVAIKNPQILDDLTALGWRIQRQRPTLNQIVDMLKAEARIEHIHYRAALRRTVRNLPEAYLKDHRVQMIVSQL